MSGLRLELIVGLDLGPLLLNFVTGFKSELILCLSSDVSVHSQFIPTDFTFVSAHAFRNNFLSLYR